MKKLLFLAVAALMMATGCDNQNKSAQLAEPETVVEQASGIYDITVKDIDGSDALSYNIN